MAVIIANNDILDIPLLKLSLSVSLPKIIHQTDSMALLNRRSSNDDEEDARE